MVARSEIVAEARTWLGTPFHHQGRVKGVGVDCAGVVLGVARTLGVAAVDVKGYGHRPDSHEMERLCNLHMTQIAMEDAQIGDVMLITIDHAPQHLAFLTDIGMLHAYAQRRKVVEHIVDPEWRAKFTAAYQLPGVE